VAVAEEKHHAMFGLRAILVVLLAFATVATAGAAPGWDQHAFRLRAWGVNEGLPGNHVAAITQDADGFLWLATMTGVVRFDGFDFHSFDASGGELPTSRFTAIDSGPSGRLWIGSEKGQLLVREHGHFKVVAPAHYPDLRVGAIAEDVDGSLWFTQGVSSLDAAQTTLFQWTGSAAIIRADLQTQLTRYPAARTYDALDKPGGPLTLESAFPQMVLERDGHGAVWARAALGSSLRLHDAVNDPLGPGDATVMMLGSAELMARRNGPVIDLLTLDGAERVASLPWNPQRLYGVWLRDNRGLVWISGTESLAAYSADSAEPVAHFELGTQLLDVMEDREGNIWIGTRERGLLRISVNPVRQFTTEEGVPPPARLRQNFDGGAAMSVQTLAYAASELDCYPRWQLLPDARPPVVDGCLWRLDDRSGTRWQFGADQVIGTRADGSTTMLDRRTDMLTEDPLQEHTLWGSFGTLYRVRTSATEPPRIDAEWPVPAQTALVFDADGGLWVGAANGLFHLHKDQLQRFGREQGLPVDDVRALYRERPGSLWLATYGGGLVHFDGQRFQTIQQRDGLIENALSGIVPGAFGALWLSGNRGVQRVQLADLQAFLAGEITQIPSMLFDGSYGMANPETTGAYSAISSGPVLYFSTFGGLVAINPERVAERERFAPQVHLLDAGANDLIAADAPLTLADGLRSLRIKYTAVHLSAPETLRFRHTLVGLDQDWVDAGTDREVEYSYLHPGHYQFRLQARHSGGRWVDAGVMPAIDVLPLWWETRSALFLGVLGIIALLVAAWRLANRQIRNRALALEALVGERTAALQIERDQVSRQATQLQELAEGRARFMSGISHELRTPLSLILAPLQDLRDGRHGSVPDAMCKEIVRIQRNAQRLLRLVERLLEVARVEASGQTLHCRPMDLRASIESLVEQLQPLADQVTSRLVAQLPDTPVSVWIDPLLMESVLVNLMVNGLKHTPAGSEVVVALEMIDDASEYAVVVRVRDNGSGIPADALPHLFERFFRVGGEHASAADGFGLGLPLVREVVERHGGLVEVSSSAAGTCFTLKLRLGSEHLTAGDLATGTEPAQRQPSYLSLAQADTETADDEPLTTASADEDRPLLLVIDDNAELRRLVRSYLEPRYRVMEFEAADLALVGLAELLPDLIISDVMMPRMDGFEFCKALRASAETSFIPVLLLTAKSGLDHRIEGLEGGADAYLAKPFDRRELQATVQALMAGQRRLRDHYLTLVPSVPVENSQSSPSFAPPAETLSKSTADVCEPSPLVARLQRVIEAHLADENFDIEALASAMAQDRTTLYRLVKTQLGLTPSELLRESRLLRAERLLRAGEGGVSEIAYAVGFKTVAHFSNSFRQRFGQAPSQLAAIRASRQVEA
jgi:signal transduction histidine kinase/DNA-binding response OmpR family regulator